MDAQALKQLQAPLKERYRAEPESALVTLRATGELTEGISCSVDTGRAIAEAGLHPASGGDGSQICSGDMLLQALAACAGVTLRAVATSIGVNLRGGTVRVEGTSTSAAPSASTRRRWSGSRTSVSASISTATQPPSSWRRSNG